MNTQRLPDELIRSAIARRVATVAEGGLRERILAATAANQQRRGWRVRLDGERLLPRRGLTLRLVVALVLLVTVALIAVLVGFRPFDTTNPPRLGPLAIVSGGDLYVAGSRGESPHLVWDLPTTATEDTSVRLWWLDSETVLLHSWISPVEGASVVNVVTGAHRLLDAGWLVAISPDRRRALIDTATTPGGRKVIEIASGAVVGEFTGSISNEDARWSPDGRSILSASTESVYRVDIASGESTVLASGLCCGLSSHMPTWSPDGTRIVYVNYDETNVGCDFRCGTLWSVPAAGGEPTRISPVLGSVLLPAFSPDGRWIAYIEDCPCEDPSTPLLVTDRLMIMATDGSGARVLAPDPRLRATPDASGYWPTPGLDSVPSGQFTWDPDSAGITYVTKAATLWHVTVDGIVMQLQGSAITEFDRQVVP